MACGSDNVKCQFLFSLFWWGGEGRGELLFSAIRPRPSLWDVLHVLGYLSFLQSSYKADKLDLMGRHSKWEIVIYLWDRSIYQ